jgi:hypothetical protein
MSINLAGTWSLRLDRDDVGVQEQWFNQPLPDTLQLPGSLQAQGYGDEVGLDTPWVGSMFDLSWFTEPRMEPYRQPGNIKVPFWLQPEKYYRGVAWYQRAITIPQEWANQRVTLMLERTHWETRVWLDDRELGERGSLSTPHVYEFGVNLAPGEHRLTIRVSNRIDLNVGPNAHSISDHTQTDWNGIIGQIELAADSPVWIDDMQIYPHVASKSATVRMRIGNALGAAGRGRLTLAAGAYNTERQHAPAPLTFEIDLSTSTKIATEFQLGDDALLWDEFSPALYRMTARIEGQVDDTPIADERATTFGMREVGVSGTQLTINERPIFLRGTLECCVFPLTGYPPTEVEPWKRIIHICQAHGLNHIRFHSWCPPEAAFVAADELGFYFQIECASWANQGASIGEGAPLDEWLYEEGRRITTAFGNHPSFIMMAYGNEPAGNFEEYLGRWVNYWKQQDPRRAHTSGAGWPAIPENNYHNIPGPRIQQWQAGLNSRINAQPPETRTDYVDWVKRLQTPIISHEIGQWCVYPNFDEIEKYRGFLKAKNYEIFRDLLNANHMGDQAHDFLMASGKLQALCYKEEIESALRTPGFAGFQLLSLNDFPGQGTALVGVLDAFWDEKGYVTPDAWARFCNVTVPLARMDKRYWRTGETFSADIDVAHFGPAPLEQAVISWKLLDQAGGVIADGALPPAMIPTGNVTRVGAAQIALHDLTPAQKYTLVVGIEGTPYENDWDIWVFADQVDTTAPDDILIVETLDAAARSRLEEGGTVLLMPRPETVATESQIGFSSVFWNTSWTNGQPPHTLGILCDPQHPVFAAFPTEYHSDWQWWELIHGAAAMQLDPMPPDLRPLVQPIDTWFENRRLGLLFEARVGNGKLMVCSMDLCSDMEQRIVARQFRHSLLRYMRSESFHPQVSVSSEAVVALTHA